jgi:putative acetyltransferase
MKILEATTEQMPIVRALFVEYAGTLEFDLGFQGFDQELASLPGHYALPSGSVLLAMKDREVAGCVALRRLGEPAARTAEMKRLYVRPQFQGQGIGRALALAILDKARKLEYKKMRLDTVPSMKAALAMYESLGFYPIAPYRENPIPGAAYLEIDLPP